MYFLYILKCNDGTLYTGITTDLARRLAQHTSGKGAKYTRGKAGRIIYFEKKKNRSSASKREAEIKSWTRKEKLALVKTQAISKT